MLRQAVEGLQPAYRQAVHLRYYGELTQREAAQRLAVTASAVAKRESVALRRLRSMLASDESGCFDGEAAGTLAANEK